MKTWIRTVSLLGLLPACAALAGCTRTPASHGVAPPPPEVSVAVPILKRVTDYEDFPGRIDAVKMIEVRARVTGYLKRVCFTEGTNVKATDPLFEIDPRPYAAEQQKAKANLDQAQVRFDRLERDFQRAQGLLTRKGISQEDYDKVVGDRAEAEAAVGVAKAQLATADLMLKFTKVYADIDGRVSRRFLDPGNMVQADVTPLTTIVALDPVYAYFDLDERSTLKARRLLREGKVKWSPGQTLPVLMGLADEEGLCGIRVWVDPRKALARGVALGDVVAALGKEPEVQVRTGVKGATERVGDMVSMLVASGVGLLASPVGDGALHAASAVAAGRTVELTLILPDRPERPAEPKRFEQLVLKTASDGKATLLKDVARVEHGPKNMGYPRRGLIEFADNRVDADTGTWRLRATFMNPDEALYPGLFVRIRLPVGTPYKALLVSQQALGTDQGQKFLYVLTAGKDKDGKAIQQVEYRRVKVGKLHDGLRVITEGLAADEKVVVSGLQRVRPGVEVRPQVVEMPVLAEPTAPAGGHPKAESRKPEQIEKPKSK